MSFFDKIKKLFEISNDETKEKVIENLNIDKLSQKVDQELESINSQKDIIKNSFSSLISSFNKDATDVIKFLKDIDLSQRKEHERIKSVVKQNLGYYIAHLEKLSYGLKGINNQDFDSYIKSLISTLNSFNKNSNIHFERATILIGKELEKAREVTNSFMREIKLLIEKQNPLIKREEILKKLSLQHSEIKKTNDFILNSNNDIGVMVKSIDDKKKFHEELLEKINTFKESDEFKKSLFENEQKIYKISETERAIQNIRQKIDIKLIAHDFHSDDKKSLIIKQYSNNFIKALKEDEELKFLGLLDSNNKELSDKLIDFREELLELDKIPTSDAEISLSKMNNDLLRLESEINSLESNIDQEKKKIDKIKSNKEEIIKNIKSLGLELNIKILSDFVA